LSFALHFFIPLFFIPGNSYEGPVFTFRTPGGFHPRHSSGVIHPTLSVRRHPSGAIHPTLSARHSLQASFL
ncbi:hypothetical protein, partial [Alistipes finegoldii]|uniref:hypothetical protein n=1 Tax=Alistipes finegoldii TaxID=214856 RepID=UPI00402A0BAE